MAAATVTATRPAQALPKRRESQRPAKVRTAIDGAVHEAHTVPPVRNLEEPYVRTSQFILKKFRGNPPSLIVHLHPTYFRFDQQEEPFSYTSPMKEFLEHLRKETVPHNMLEELLKSGVKFYDSCLIVEIHDHRNKDASKSAKVATAKDAKSGTSNVHDPSEHLTPSPFVPHPDQIKKVENPEADGQADGVDGKEKADGQDKENMLAPGQPISSRRKKEAARVFTRVLHSTPMCLHVEKQLLAMTPIPDRSSRKQQAANGTKDGAPPTPKRQKMMLDEKNHQEFEASVLIRENPVLYLEPAKNFREVQETLELLQHPLYSNPPPKLKSRKRTSAEMEADDKQAAADENFMLAGDERLRPVTSAAAGGNAAAGDGQGGTGTFQPGYSRFKVLENIKAEHAEQERLKKEEESRALQMKREQQEQQRRKDMEERAKEAAMARARQQQQQAHMQQQAAAQQAAMARAQAMQEAQLAQQAAAAQAAQQRPQPRQTPAQGTPMMAAAMPNMPQVSQAPHMSPVVRNGTPMNASSPMMGPVTTMPMGGQPMAARGSLQGAGSPPRPPSAMQQGSPAMEQAMARQVSRQAGSQQGTPQMTHGTPIPQGIPVNRQMQGTPRINRGSPINGGMAGPGGQMLMGGAPMMGNQQLTPEQVAMLRTRQITAQAMAQGRNLTQEEMQQMQTMRAFQQARLAASQGQTPQMYQAQLARQMQHQMAHLQGNGPGNPAGTPQPQMMTNPNDPQATAARQQQIQQQIQQQRARAHLQQQRMQQQQQQIMMQQIANENGGHISPELRQRLMQAGAMGQNPGAGGAGQQMNQQYVAAMRLQAQQMQQQQQRMIAAAQMQGKGMQGQNMGGMGMGGIQGQGRGGM